MNLITRTGVIAICFVLFACSQSQQEVNQAPAQETAPVQETTQLETSTEDRRPNIILLVADDMGYSDLSSFGSEINTPNLDSLASAGKVLTNLHVSPTCSPTRAMMMTGVEAHRAGLGTMNGMQSPEQVGKPGYEGFLNAQSVTFVSLLRDAGYHTYMAGKWQLGYEPGYYPLDRGFDKAFWYKWGGASHFSDMNGMTKAYHKKGWYEGEEPLESLPEDFYSTNNFTDKIIEYIDSNKDDNQPFFVYGAYTAPHWPLHAPQEYIDMYEGVYDAGYDVIREARIERMQNLGLIEEGQVTASQHELWPSWDELGDEEKKLEARRMQVYAAMLAALDDNIGRLVEHLKDIDEYDNTFIMFFSDNGADGNNPMDFSNNYEWVPTVFDNSHENMGKSGSYISTGPGWAHVSNTPFGLYKAFPTQGGLRTSAFTVYTSEITAGSRSDAFASILDVAPTILELAEVDHPAPEYKGRQVNPMQGKSMLALLRDEQQQVHSPGHVYGIELFNRRMIMQDDWKLLQLNDPWGDNAWSLYNLVDDPAEQNDLVSQEPEKLAAMVELWDQYVTENGIFVFPEISVRWTNSTIHYQTTD